MQTSGIVAQRIWLSISLRWRYHSLYALLGASRHKRLHRFDLHLSSIIVVALTTDAICVCLYSSDVWRYQCVLSRVQLIAQLMLPLVDAVKPMLVSDRTTVSNLNHHGTICGLLLWNSHECIERKFNHSSQVLLLSKQSLNDGSYIKNMRYWLPMTTGS